MTKDIHPRDRQYPHFWPLLTKCYDAGLRGQDLLFVASWMMKRELCAERATRRAALKLIVIVSKPANLNPERTPGGRRRPPLL